MKGIKIWVISGIVYLAIVITSYSLITGANPLTSGEMDHGDDHNENNYNEQYEDGDNMHHNDNGHDNHNDDQNNNDEDMHDHGHGDHDGGDSEVDVHVTYEDGKIQVHLEDNEGNAPELLENHERIMHLIVVGDNFEKYNHFHPTQLEDDLFEAEASLEEGKYYVFVDITPKDKEYTIKPITIEAGGAVSRQLKLTPDDELVKTVSGKEVELSHSSLTTEEPVTFIFDLKDNTPQPYLGALGHVVILDENVDEFIHVHPVSTDETVFEAHFSEPGKYKLWAEFKFEDEGVLVYPFVIEIE